jgi:hypothetical protein
VCAIPTAFRQESLTALAAEQYGVLSAEELRACGLTDNGIARRVAQGRLHRVHASVFAVGHPALRPEGRWLAAVKACGPGALLSHAAALMLYGVLAFDDRWADVTVDYPGCRRVAGVKVHRTRDLPAEDVRSHNGIPVTSVERALLDVAATWTDKAVRRAMATAQSKA